MILIGQYDSPFVRRVAVALQLYRLSYEHRPWSAVGDADRIAAFNPLMRVPTLVADDGRAFTDSSAILQLLDHLTGAEAFLSRDWPEQGEVVRLSAFATGVADKAVALVYDRASLSVSQPTWRARLTRQVEQALAMLEQERSERSDDWLFGARISHADVAIGTMWRFLNEALPGAIDRADYPSLERHSARCEALPEFRNVSQPFKLTTE